MVSPDDTIYTKDAKIMANLKVNIETLILTLRIQLGQHGHSIWGSTAIIHALGGLTEIHQMTAKCSEQLSEEVKANIDLILAGQIGTGEED